MSRHRLPARGSKYYVDPRLYNLSVDYVRLYPVWKRELANDPPEERREDLQRRVDNIHSAAAKAAPDDVLRDYLLLAISHDLSFPDLVNKGIPCDRKVFYRIRRAFFFQIAQKIK